MARPPLHLIEDLFHRAIEIEAGKRAAFLDDACAGDRELRAAVEELLRHDEGTGQTEAFIVSPIERAPADSERTSTGAGTGEAVPLPQQGPPGYELLEVLGSGGMGVVFKARQVSLNRIVALKMLLTAAPVTAERLARFRTEAESLAQLQHPNIVQIFEVNEYQGRPYLVMQFVFGPNLAVAAHGNPQPARDAAELVKALALAIQAVHERGIIHRDLKPANVLLQIADRGLQMEEPDGANSSQSAISNLQSAIPLITDFGLAKRLGADSSQTSAGAVLGTPSYMAPEQARGSSDRLGTAVDIYALGAILYELLTGRPPFKGTSPEETVTQVVFEEPISPARLRSSLPRDLVTTCLKCLEKEPRQRYASAALLAEDLRRFLAGEPISARPVSFPERVWRWCRRRPAVAALAATSSLLAVALVITVVVYQSMLLKQTEHKLEGAEQQVEQERRQLSTLDHTLAARELEQGDACAALLWLIEALRLDTDHPDDEWIDRIGIALTLQHCPRLVEALTLDRGIAAVQLGSLGCWLATLGEDSTVTVLEVTKSQVLALRGAILTGSKSVTITISPDGRFLAVASEERSTQVWNLNTGRPHLAPLRHGSAVHRANFSDDNGFLTTQHTDGRVQVWDLNTGQRLLPDAGPNQAMRYAAPSDNGRWLFTLSFDGLERVHKLPEGKTHAGPLKMDHAPACAALDANGQQLALTDADNALWIRDTRTGKERPLVRATGSEATITQIHWNADGRLLLTVDDQNQIRVWNAVTGSLVTPPLAHAGPVLSAGFAGDGKVLTVSRDGLVQVWQLPETRREALGLAITVLKGGSIDAANFPTDDRPLADLVALAQALSGRRIRANGTLEPIEPEQLRATRRALRSGSAATTAR